MHHPQPNTNILPVASVHGRFQIFHNEHLEYLLAAFSRAEFVFIGITAFDIRNLGETASAPHRSQLRENPLTYFERTQMIRDALVEASIQVDRFSFSPFPIETPSILPDFVPVAVPCLTTIRETWNREKIETLRRVGYEVIVLWERMEPKIAASTIRSMIVADDPSWKKLVPEATAGHIRRLALHQRLLRL